MNNIKQPETNFEVYDDKTDKKAHEMLEVDGIPELDLCRSILHRIEII